MLRKALVMLMLAGVATTAAAADLVYKWLDANGQIHYSDLPPTAPGAKLLGTFERDTVVEEGATLDDQANPPADTTPTPADEGADSATRAQVAQDVAKARAEECKKAQARYQTYIQSQRLYRPLPDGKREYLSDAELAAARIQAKKEMDELCK